MRSIAIIALSALLLVRPVGADPATDPVQSVIDAQIAAFAEDDMARAFSFASPGLRRHFGTSDRFGAMVRQGYPMVRQPGALRYLDQTGQGETRRQIVEITDRAGQLFRLEYTLLATPEGWRIDAVRFLPLPVPMG